MSPRCEGNSRASPSSVSTPFCFLVLSEPKVPGSPGSEAIARHISAEAMRPGQLGRRLADIHAPFLPFFFFFLIFAPSDGAVIPHTLIK